MKLEVYKNVLNSDKFKVIIFIILFAVIGLDLNELEPDSGLDFWFEFHEIFYLGALFVGWLSIFKVSFFWSSFGGVLLGFLSSYIDLFDEILHPFFSDHVFSFPAFAGNPQYTKLMMYSLVFTGLCISILVVRRKLHLVFCLTLLCVNLFLVLNNHFSYPDGIFKKLIQQRLEELSTLQNIDVANVKIYCELYHLACRLKSYQGIVEFPPRVKLSQDFQLHYNSLKHNINIPFATSALDTNKTPSLYRTFVRNDGYTIEIYDPNKIRDYWQMNAFYFYRNSSLVSAGWYLFFIALGFVHRKILARKG